jgi:enoyl-CoA hydratase/carnithine racemase
MSYWSCKTEGGVVTASYSNPPMNYFCADGAMELGTLIESWQDPAIKAVVLASGVAGKFITHYSVEELLSYAEDREALRKSGTALTAGYHGLLLSLRNLSKPVIVAMSGDAMGGGFELCLACDIRIGMRGDFRYGLPEVKLGILPGGSGTQRLSRLIGAGRAIDFILRGRIVRPEEALAMGLVHELADDALAHAVQLAREMVHLPPLSIAMIKRAVYEGVDTSLADGLDIESEGFLATMLSDDGVTAMRDYVAQPLEQRRNWLEKGGTAKYVGH